MRNKLRPMVSNTRDNAPTATVSIGRFSVKIWEMNYVNPISHILTYCIPGDDATYTWSTRSEEDQASKIGSSLVAQGPGSVNQSTHTIGLDGTADKSAAPEGGGRSGFLGFGELFCRVRGLGTTVGVAENGGKDGEGGGVGEDGAEGDSRRLNGGEVW